MSKACGSTRKLVTTALLLLPLTGACDDDGTDPIPDNVAMLSVFLTDAPGDVDSAWVQIDDVVLVGAGGNISVLDEPTGLLNLTALHDSATSLADSVELDAATFHEVRLVLGGAVLQTTAGDVYIMGGAEHPHGTAATGDLMCPSCTQSGLKVKLPGDVALEEGTNGILLDFDVSQSFGHQAGNSGKWIMHPVIHATEGEPDDLDDGEPLGLISGTVVLGLDSIGDTIAVPECVGEARTLASFIPTATSTTLTDDEGEFLMFAGETESEEGDFQFEIGVADFDTYALSYAAETMFDGGKLVWEATAVPDTAIVAEGSADVGGVVFTVTSASCVLTTP